MQLLHSSKCCCCADLRTGGLILGYLGLIGAILQIFEPKAQNLVGAVVAICAYGAFLYGIYTKKTDWMLPGVVLSCIGLVSLVISFIVFLFAAIFARQYVVDYINNKDGHDKFDINDAYVVACIIILAIIAITAVLVWHFTSVMFSLWKSMKEGARPNAMYGA